MTLDLEALKRGLDDLRAHASRGPVSSREIFTLTDPLMDMIARSEAAPSGQAPLEGVWPDFKAPQQYENPAEGWTDPGLPDFRAIWAAAYSVGYSVGLHGSMKRDCDLIAAPWTDEAVSPEELVEAICKAINAKPLNDLQKKPMGRVALTLNVADTWSKPIDLSIAPRLLPASAEPVAEGEYELAETVHGEIVRIIKRHNPLKEPVASPPASGAVEAGWRCKQCNCHSFARMDEVDPNSRGHFRPGARCVNCKDVSRFPAAPTEGK